MESDGCGGSAARDLAFSVVGEVLGEFGVEGVVTASTPLLGADGVVDSMGLVQVCVALEDAAEGAGLRFDWTSDAAMSRSRGVYRTVGSLVEEFGRQQAQGAGS